MSGIPKAVSDYYAKAPETHKQTLLEMRTRILEIAPGAEEVIKYSMPTFIFNGIAIAGLMVHKNHIGYYPYSGSVLDKFPEMRAKYNTTKGALHIPPSKPLLKSEIKKLINTRLKLSQG